MALSELVSTQIPFLRRYARILTGSQKLGDGLVRELLASALADQQTRETISSSRVALFAAFSRIYRSVAAGLAVHADAGNLEQETVAERLDRITPDARQALILESVEDFSLPQIAEILDRSLEEVSKLIEDAIREIDESGQTDVLIIEDEPLIAYQLEQLVTAIGNRVVGIATTHEEAVALFEAHRPGIVLADIQLADGSSGIDAVNDIMRDRAVPVIFITAFPERLLTGERPEPTYLITKPFSDDFVRATIGQVMFFGSTAHLV